jgi:dTDP-4-dehydrorhamnose reductase
VYDTQGRDDFVLTMLRLAAERDVLKVVDDQLGSPTWARSIADATAQALLLVRQMKVAPGIYNLAALGAVSRFDFTARLLERTRAMRTDRPAAKLQPIDTSEFPLPAVRPLNSVLTTDKIVAAGVPMTTWQEQLDGFVSELGFPPGTRG